MRAFEAAARLGSFKEAADELFVTPTAISHQIRSLESQLQASLFIRKTRRVELTPAGKALAPALTRGFLEIRSGLEDVLEQASIINVSTTPAFAALRLVPELPRFYQQEPDIRVKIDTSTRLVDLHRDRDTDLAIRYSRNPQADLEDIPLMEERFVALAAVGTDATALEAEATLLHTRWQQPVLEHVSWQEWFAVAGLTAPGEERILAFDEELYVLQAAMAGHGIALASSVLAADLVNRGLLQPLREDIALTGATYRIVALPNTTESNKVRKLVNWLENTFGEDT
ncbi:MAG: LysR substrate-binding domain-containing protein [Pseudomonadaceae bacterium]|nr:LysR substrate-binding domain-containing protein [Pseudomonadaceae bacterium]